MPPSGHFRNIGHWLVCVRRPVAVLDASVGGGHDDGLARAELLGRYDVGQLALPRERRAGA